MNYPSAHLQWGVRGSAPGEFHFPIGIAINAMDELFVADFYNDRVQQFSTDGELLGCFAVSPNPGGIATDESGNIYICHFGVMRMDEEKKPDKVTVWNSRGDFLHEWGKSGAGAGEFNFPGGLVVGRNERLYVADQTNHRIQVFDTTGRYITEWGKYGTKTGEFGGNTSAASRVGGPQFVAVDSSGHIYTTEGSMGRVQKFTPEGEFLLAWGDNNTTEGSFGGGWQIDSEEGLQGPIGILADRYDTIWVSAAGGRVQQFSNNGEYLRGIGEGKGTGPGQFLVPHGLTMDSRDNLYVVDSFNHRIQKFHIPR